MWGIIARILVTVTGRFCNEHMDDERFPAFSTSPSLDNCCDIALFTVHERGQCCCLCLVATDLITLRIDTMEKNKPVVGI